MGKWVKVTKKTPKHLAYGYNSDGQYGKKKRYYVQTVKRGGRYISVVGGYDSSGRAGNFIDVSGGSVYRKGKQGLKLVGFTETPAGKLAEKNYFSRLYEKRKEQERAALKKKLQEQKTFESQVDVLRTDLDKQFSNVITGLKERRWSPRFKTAKLGRAQELSTMQKKLAGLSREKWLTEVEELSKKDTKNKSKSKRRLTRSAYDSKLMSGVGRRLSGRK